MKTWMLWISCALSVCPAAWGADGTRIFVVSSYHREYLWSQSTHEGLCAALLDGGYLDNVEQVRAFTKYDEVESSRVVVKKEWMDTKRHNSTADIARTTVRIMESIRQFEPDLVLLGDDNAANYIGNQLLDTAVPVVFWGINGIPLKYGLIDALDEPGHNVTGVWQSGYHKESLELLHSLVPAAKTFAILACDSETSRPTAKQIEALARTHQLSLRLHGIVMTNSFAEFRRQTLALAKEVDAFFVLNHDTMKDENGDHVDMMTVGKWYLEHIRQPEVSHEDQFVREGMLCSANDSGFNQGYTAFELARRILEDGVDPAFIPPRTPERGPLIVNFERATMLGLGPRDKLETLADELVEEALALQ